MSQLDESIEDLEGAILDLKRALEKANRSKQWEQKTTWSVAYGSDPKAPKGDGWQLVGLLALAKDPDDDAPMVYYYWQREVPEGA